MSNENYLNNLKLAILKGQYESGLLIYKIKKRLTLSQMNELQSFVSKNQLEGKIFGEPPSTYGELKKSDLSYLGDSLKKELYWSFSKIKSQIHILSKYLEHKRIIEKCFILGDYTTALETLKSLNENFGYSIWGLEIEFLLQEYVGGIEKNKEFLNSINSLNPDIIIALLADFYSYKAEKNISLTQYYNRIIATQYSNINILSSYLNFKLANPYEYTVSDLINILFLEGNSSIIDIYETLLGVCQQIQLISGNNQEMNEIKVFLIKILPLFYSALDDRRWDNILRYLDASIPLKLRQTDIEMIEITDLYTSGNYEVCLNRSKQLIEKEPSFALFEICAKSMMYLDFKVEDLPDISIKEALVKNLFLAYTKKENQIEVQRNLSKYTILMLKSELRYSLNRFMSSRYEYELKQSYIILEQLNSCIVNPRFCLAYLSTANQETFLNKVSRTLSFESSTIMLFKHYLLSDNSEETKVKKTIPLLRLQRYAIISEIVNKKYDKSVVVEKLIDISEASQQINEHVGRYLLEKITVELYNVYLQNDDHLEALQLFVNTFLSDRNLTLRMDISNLAHLLRRTRDKSIKKLIDLPILMQRFARGNYSSVFPSVSNYLDCCGVDRPSQLNSITSNCSTGRLIYFLRYVCSLEIIGSLVLVFQTEEEVLRERTNILQVLISIDPENENEYVRELSQINQKLRISNKVKVIDESRIDINVNGIKKDQDSMYREAYERYISISSRNLKGIDITQFSDVKDIFGLGKVNKDQENLSYLFFKEALIDIRNQFVFNNKYGLDATLSTRIRHGALMNEMRSPFENQNLILSKRNHQSERYELNPFWGETLNELTEEETEQIRIVLEDFSKKIDSKIYEINTEWIRILTEIKPVKGFFNYVLSDAVVRNIYEIFYSSAVKNSEDFFDIIIVFLWRMTEENLTLLRTKIKDEIGFYFINCIQLLERKINDLQYKLSLSEKIHREFHSKITNCRVDAQNQLDKISNWFKISKNKDDSDFDANLLVDTFIETYEMLNPLYKEIKITSEIVSGSVFSGTVFTYLIDILSILFNNAVQHSGFHNLTDLEVDISIIENDKTSEMIIEMKNNLSSDMDIIKLKENIQKIITNIANEDYIKDYSAKEGGTGFIKISKIFTYILEIQAFIGIDVVDDSKFRVMLMFNNKTLLGITKENSHEHSFG
ncbi:hypothetical protein D7Z26_12100 [Cohnella endophytica]|uniref:Uncharacterized protein n=1 Tax=Cohnella endophytica TaxID=2419778 RepID=A0A494XU71_9BACL|nr:hypothetical protein [Cohnella endophytica]RKP54120.1 hypothetical protein D7Z26_12100 [Cohnella endophytica]